MQQTHCLLCFFALLVLALFAQPFEDVERRGMRVLGLAAAFRSRGGIRPGMRKRLVILQLDFGRIAW